MFFLKTTRERTYNLLNIFINFTSTSTAQLLKEQNIMDIVCSHLQIKNQL